MNRKRTWILLALVLLPVLCGATFRITGGTLVLPSGCVVDDAISTTAGIDADKMEHVYKAGTNFDLAVGGTPATREETVFIASTSGVIRGFHFSLTDTGTNTSIAWEFKKNGTTVLSGAGSSTHSDTDRQVKDGSLSVTTFAADDHFTIAMTVTSATGAVGPFAWAEFQETAP
jgi:hypothetical protein